MLEPLDAGSTPAVSILNMADKCSRINGFNDRDIERELNSCSISLFLSYRIDKIIINKGFAHSSKSTKPHDCLNKCESAVPFTRVHNPTRDGDMYAIK